MVQIPPQMRVNPAVEDLLQAQTGFNAAVIYEQLTADLPEGTIIKMDPLDYNPTNSFSLNITYRDAMTGHGNFNFFRTLNIEEKRAYHGDAGVSEGLRDQGIARTVTANLINFYQALGIETIKLAAVDIGIYAWGRLGFVPDQNSWDGMREEIAKRLDHLEAYPPSEGPLSVQCVDLLRHAVSQQGPKNFWLVVDQQKPCNGDSLGKVLTLEQRFLKGDYHGNFDRMGWSGSFNLKDSDCMMRMSPDAQLHKKPEPKPAGLRGMDA